MKWIDMHCDTLSALVKQNDANAKNKNRPAGDLYRNPFCVDMDRLVHAECAVQFFACYVDMLEYRQGLSDRAFDAVKRMLGYAHSMSGIKPGFRIAEEIADVQEALRSGRTAGILTVEEGGVLDGSLLRLEELYQKGVRLLTLTWNYENCIGWPNSRDPEVMEKGLKKFGFQVVDKMNSIGMVIDVSHLSDGGFWDCIRASRTPVAASHSNARSLCLHPRNLSDGMLRALGEKGGVAGLNFYGRFLRKGGRASVRDIAEHAAYMIGKAGEEAVALGTDFDGFDPEDLPQGIRGVEDMEKVWEAMKKRRITERQLDKLVCGNVARLLYDVWKR